MVVIGFFRDLFSQFGALVNFVTSPISSFSDNAIVNFVFGDMSIISMLGVGLLATLGVFLAVRLFQMVNPF